MSDGPGAASDTFPEDLTGHFWATLEHVEVLRRWRFSVMDYGNDVVLTGIAVSEAQAARIVRAGDAVITADFPGSGDPSVEEG